MENVNETNVQEDSSLWELTKEMGTLGAKLTGIVACEVFSHRWIVQLATENGHCLGNYLPNRILPYTKQLVNFLTVPTTWLRQVTGMDQRQEGNVIAPVLEELQFRYLFQQVVLKQIPQATLDKIFPDHQINFDTLPLKAIRILLTAALFAIAHMQYYSCENGGGVSVFLGGALYSALIESGEPLTTTMILHTIWNTFAPYLNQLI